MSTWVYHLYIPAYLHPSFTQQMNGILTKYRSKGSISVVWTCYSIILLQFLVLWMKNPILFLLWCVLLTGRLLNFSLNKKKLLPCYFFPAILPRTQWALSIWRLKFVFQVRKIFLYLLHIFPIFVIFSCIYYTGKISYIIKLLFNNFLMF